MLILDRLDTSSICSHVDGNMDGDTCAVHASVWDVIVSAFFGVAAVQFRSPVAHRISPNRIQRISLDEIKKAAAFLTTSIPSLIDNLRAEFIFGGTQVMRFTTTTLPNRLRWLKVTRQK